MHTLRLKRSRSFRLVYQFNIVLCITALISPPPPPPRQAGNTSPRDDSGKLERANWVLQGWCTFKVNYHFPTALKRPVSSTASVICVAASELYPDTTSFLSGRFILPLPLGSEQRKSAQVRFPPRTMMTGFRLNLSPLKEPLGFVKLVEWVSPSDLLETSVFSVLVRMRMGGVWSELTAIFAFGSCGGYSGTNVISLFCGNGTNETLSAAFSYPFRLSQVSLVEANLTFCNHTAGPTHLVGDSASSAEFFVGVGVVCFLYSMVALLVYLGYMHVYKDSDFGPIIDFLLTAALAFLWLLSSSAWARGLQNVKHATGDAGVAATLGVCARGDVTCRVTEFASLRSLNVSVVFGFLNLCVWAGNAWFVYKETRWHAQKHGGQAAPQRTQVPAAI
ncbi:unnamed protein product [Boreogadus saida]